MQLAFYVFYCVADKPWPNKLDGKQLSLSTAQQEGSTVNIKRALLAKSCLYEAQQCTSIDNASTRTCSAHQSCATIKQNAVQLHWWRTMHCRVFKANTLFLLSTKQAGAKTTPRSAPRNKNEKPCGAPFGLFSHWLLQFIATEQWIKLTKMNGLTACPIYAWKQLLIWTPQTKLSSCFHTANNIYTGSVHYCYWLNTPWSYI